MNSSLRAAAHEIYAAMRPPPPITLTEWAEAHRVIPPPASEPGPYRSDRVPYMRDIMTAMTDKSVRKVVVMKAGQLGASEALLCCVGYFTSLDPCAMMMVLPTLENARQWSREKLNPLFETTRCLKGLLRPSSSRDADNTISVKRTANGGLIVVVGGEAATGLISRAVKVLFIDELDHMGLSAGGEGSPVYLAEIRQSSYWDAKTYIVSTPVNLDTSEIYKRWLHSDMRRYHCPCPHCGELQHLKFDQVKWTKTDAGERLPHTAMYVCEHCGTCWSDAERHQAVAKGVWIAEHPGRDDAVGFHLPGLLSPWTTHHKLVTEWLASYRDPHTLQVFLNTKLALPFQENYQAMKPESLIARRELYDTESLPDDILLLTAGIDCQQDRVEIQVLGFGLGEETWYVNYEVIYGDVARMDIWREVDAFRTTPYRTTSGRKLFIQACCVDTGGIAGSLAFEYSKAVRKQRVFPVRGSSQGIHQIWPKIQGRHVPKEHKVFTVSVDACKEILYARVKVTRSGPGCLHFSMDCDEEYFEQLQSEFQRIRKDRFGRAHREWVLPSGKRNEVLDCWNYAYCALKSFPANVLQSLAEQRKAATAAASPPPPSDDCDQPEERKDQTAEPWLAKTGWFGQRGLAGELIRPGSPELVTPGPQSINKTADLFLPATISEPVRPGWYPGCGLLAR